MTRKAEPVGRDAVLAAARRRFLQWGYSGTSTATLAEDLGLTKAALYYHFPDKEALFLAVVEDYLDAVSADLAALGEVFARGSESEALVALAEVFLSRHTVSAQMQQLSFQESRHLSPEGQLRLSGRYHEALVGPVSGYLRQAADRGWLRAPAPDEPAAIWVFLGLLTAFLKPGHESTPEAAHRSALAFVRLFRAALCPPAPSSKEL